MRTIQNGNLQLAARTKRTSAITLLRQRSCQSGQWQAHAVSAGCDATTHEADSGASLIKRLLPNRDDWYQKRN